MIGTYCIYRINFTITIRKGARYGFDVPIKKTKIKTKVMSRELCFYATLSHLMF